MTTGNASTLPANDADTGGFQKCLPERDSAPSCFPAFLRNIRLESELITRHKQPNMRMKQWTGDRRVQKPPFQPDCPPESWYKGPKNEKPHQPGFLPHAAKPTLTQTQATETAWAQVLRPALLQTRIHNSDGDSLWPPKAHVQGRGRVSAQPANGATASVLGQGDPGHSNAGRQPRRGDSI